MQQSRELGPGAIFQGSPKRISPKGVMFGHQHDDFSQGIMTSWFALHVRSRQEKIVSCILSSKGLEQFLPVYRSKRKWIDRVREIDLPLFPGYVFCRFNPEARIPVVTTPGVVDIVRCGRMFAAVDPAEIAALQALMKSQLPAQPWRYMEAGQQVMIEGGVLDGVVGVLVQTKNSKKVVLRVTALQRSVLVEIDGERITSYPPQTQVRAFCPVTGGHEDAAQAMITLGHGDRAPTRPEQRRKQAVAAFCSPAEL